MLNKKYDTIYIDEKNRRNNCQLFRRTFRPFNKKSVDCLSQLFKMTKESDAQIFESIDLVAIVISFVTIIGHLRHIKHIKHINHINTGL